jgi:hypothetical protein
MTMKQTLKTYMESKARKKSHAVAKKQIKLRMIRHQSAMEAKNA